MTFPIDANEYFKRVRRDPELLAQAMYLYAQRSGDLMQRPPKTAISRSDAGRCGKQVAVEIAGGYDLEDDAFEARDQGTLRGLYKACCLQVAIEAEDPTLVVILEQEAAWNGIGGHSDLSVYSLPGPRGAFWGVNAQTGDLVLSQGALWTLEIKHPEQYDVIEPHLPRLSKAKKTLGVELQPPRWDYVTQGGASALSDGGSIFSVAIWGLGSSFAQGNYEVQPDGYVYTLGAGDDEPALLNVADDYARIALGEMDPTRDFYCKSCRWSECPANANPLKAGTVDLEAALLASVEAAS